MINIHESWMNHEWLSMSGQPGNFCVKFSELENTSTILSHLFKNTVFFYDKYQALFHKTSIRTSNPFYRFFSKDAEY